LGVRRAGSEEGLGVRRAGSEEGLGARRGWWHHVGG